MSTRTADPADATGEVTELLQHLIRNACVNDGTPASGQEARNADLLASYLEGTGLDLARYEAAPGRANLVARIEGSQPGAPTLLLMGHMDVVPVNREGWRHDPFGGELIDGEIWGRGAVDMLNQTASMAVAFKRLARGGLRPKGTLIYLGVADEEALGTYGAAWLLEHEPDAVRTDYVVTESGGFRIPMPSTRPGAKLPVMVGEKGAYWAHVRVKGTPGHGSMPLRTDNALVKAARVVQRLAEFHPRARVDDLWRVFVEQAELPEPLSGMLLDPVALDAYVADTSTDTGLARLIHACTHTTIAPTIAHGGVKTNVIPDRVDLQLDIRTLPGDTDDDVRSMLYEAIGADLVGDVEIVADAANPASASTTDTPLWDSLARVSRALVPGATTIPLLLAGATDARFFRWAGVTAYGCGLFSDRISLADFGSMFHGDDERIDQGSLRLSEALFEGVARDLLG